MLTYDIVFQIGMEGNVPFYKPKKVPGWINKDSEGWQRHIKKTRHKQHYYEVPAKRKLTQDLLL